MGEIADMMLDGTLCQECGVMVAHSPKTRAEMSPGFPRSCQYCKEEAEAGKGAEPCPECKEGKLIGAIGGGEKCNKCDYWFCF